MQIARIAAASDGSAILPRLGLGILASLTPAELRARRGEAGRRARARTGGAGLRVMS